MTHVLSKSVIVATALLLLVLHPDLLSKPKWPLSEAPFLEAPKIIAMTAVFFSTKEGDTALSEKR